MNVKSIIKSLLVCGAFVIFATSAQADDKTAAAVESAKRWLALVDGAQYAKSWQEAAPFFKAQVNAKIWEEQISAVRAPLGKAESRELVGAQFVNELPGAPEGEFVVIQFKTDFANKPDSVETITPMMVDGSWRVSGYFIR